MKFQILGIILLLALVTAVSADVTCSFINITTGPQGPPGVNGTTGATGPAGPMNQTPNMTAGPQGPPGADGAIPDVSQFLFINGTRAMAGNLSMGGFYINSLLTGGFGSDAVNKSYVDAVNTSMKGYVDALGTSNYNASYNSLIRGDYVYTGNLSYVLTNNASYVLTNNASYVLTNNASYLMVNGSRAMTANLSIGNFYILNVTSGTSAGSVVNKSYVDSKVGSDVAPDGNLSVMFNFNNIESGCSTFTYNNQTGTVTATAFAGDGAGITGIVGGTAVSIDIRAGEALGKGQPVYISGSSGNKPQVMNADNLITGHSRVVGLVSTTLANNDYGQIRRAGILTGVDTRIQNTVLNPLGQTWVAGDLLFLEQTGGLTNIRPTSGRSVKVAYTLEGSKLSDTLLAYPMENPVWATAAAGEQVVDRLGDSVGATNLSIRNYTNFQVAYVDSFGKAAFNGTALTNNLTMGNFYITGLSSGTSNTSVVNKSYVDAKSTVFGYVTLMAGSAMVTTTTPTVMNQWETTTNKNNYISLNFTDGGSEGAQWIVDFPADWNATAPVVFTPVWTAAEGSGTVNFTVAGKLFPDDAALDTALLNISSSVDTLITAGDVHVGPATTGAAITSVATGGNTAIIRVVRDSATDTLSGTAQLLGLRVKYIRTMA